jgi:hypothetical protein
MKKMTLVLAYMGIAAGSAAAADQAFPKTQIPDAKGHQVSAALLFRDSQGMMQVSSAGQVLLEVPYSSIDRFSYEYTKKHRITQGAVVMVASVGAGAVVMLTQSRKHFLTIEYHDGTVPKQLVLRMDKSEYRDILAAVEAQTGKNVVGKAAIQH